MDEVAHLLAALRRHCDDVGTDYEGIEKQVMAGRLDPTAAGFWDRLEKLRDLGVDLAVLNVRAPDPRGWTESLAREVVPRLSSL